MLTPKQKAHMEQRQKAAAQTVKKVEETPKPTPPVAEKSDKPRAVIICADPDELFNYMFGY